MARPGLTEKTDREELQEILAFFKKFGSGKQSEITTAVTISTQDSKKLEKCVVKLCYLSFQEDGHNFSLDIENTDPRATYSPLNDFIRGYVSHSQKVAPAAERENVKEFEITGDDGTTLGFELQCINSQYHFNIEHIINVAIETQQDITITIPRLGGDGKTTGINDYIIFSKSGYFTWVPGEQKDMGQSQLSADLRINLSESMRDTLESLEKPGKKAEQERIFGKDKDIDHAKMGPRHHKKTQRVEESYSEKEQSDDEYSYSSSQDKIDDARDKKHKKRPPLRSRSETKSRSGEFTRTSGRADANHSENEEPERTSPLEIGKANEEYFSRAFAANKGSSTPNL